MPRSHTNKNKNKNKQKQQRNRRRTASRPARRRPPVSFISRSVPKATYTEVKRNSSKVFSMPMREEYVTEISSAENFAAKRITINAGLPGFSSILSVFASRYEKYRFKHLEFWYMGEVSNDTNGWVTMAPDYNASSTIPGTKQEISNHEGSITGKVFQRRITCNLDVRSMFAGNPWKNIRCSGTGESHAAFDAGIFNFAVGGVPLDPVTGQPFPVGQLWMKYQCEFKNPIVPVTGNPVPSDTSVFLTVEKNVDTKVTTFPDYFSPVTEPSAAYKNGLGLKYYTPSHSPILPEGLYKLDFQWVLGDGIDGGTLLVAWYQNGVRELSWGYFNRTYAGDNYKSGFMSTIITVPVGATWDVSPGFLWLSDLGLDTLDIQDYGRFTITKLRLGGHAVHDATPAATMAVKSAPVDPLSVSIDAKQPAFGRSPPKPVLESEEPEEEIETTEIPVSAPQGYTMVKNPPSHK